MPPKRGGREPRARAEAVALPRTAARERKRPALAPSRKSVLVGLAIVVLAVAGYSLARSTSVFAIRRIDVSGASPAVAGQVERTLQQLLGRSLVGLNGGAVVRRVDALPTVVGARVDRAFPHALHVTVVPERPVAVLRQGSGAWLVSARGRLMARVAPAADASLPRIWVGTATQVGAAGDFAPADAGGTAARALAFAPGFPARILTATAANGVLTFRLSSGISLRLGDSGDLPLKLAVARRALRVLPSGTTYVDVSQPGRPVSGAEVATSSTVTTTTTNPQVSRGG